jgi:hypothetical protein
MRADSSSRMDAGVRRHLARVHEVLNRHLDDVREFAREVNAHIAAAQKS